jgi:hypothetical protein
MQTSSRAQPARITSYDRDCERFQDSDRPILQNVMASISASDEAYNA